MWSTWQLVMMDSEGELIVYNRLPKEEVLFFEQIGVGNMLYNGRN
jgi:hypothetical protein